MSAGAEGAADGGGGGGCCCAAAWFPAAHLCISARSARLVACGLQGVSREVEGACVSAGVWRVLVGNEGCVRERAWACREPCVWGG